MKRALLAALLFVAAPRVALACAGCRNPNLPITRVTSAQLRPGEARASAVLSATAMHVVHDAGCPDPAACTERPVQPAHQHDQRIYPGELRAIVEVGLTSTLGVEAHVPFRVTSTTVRYTTPDGAPYEPLDRGVHHRDETLAGIGDPWLLGRWARPFGGFSFSARLGLSLPLGRTEPDPFALGDQGLRHQHIQFGTGTFDPVAAVDLERTWAGTSFTAYAQAQLSLYENRHGFRAGPRTLAGLQAGRRIFGRLTAALGADVMHEGAERWDGSIQQDGNLGRTEVLASLSLVQSFRTVTLGVSARVPLYRHLVTGDEPPGKLSAPLMVSVLVSRVLWF